VYVAYAAYLID